MISNKKQYTSGYKNSIHLYPQRFASNKLDRLETDEPCPPISEIVFDNVMSSRIATENLKQLNKIQINKLKL